MLKSCAQLDRQFKESTIPPSTRRVLGIERKHYTSAADAALIAVRMENARKLAKNLRGEAVVGVDYQLLRQQALTEEQGMKKMKRLHTELGSSEFAKKYIVTPAGKSCYYPCSVNIHMPDVIQSIDDVVVECKIQHKITTNASNEAIQKEVLRLARLMGIKPAVLPQGRLKSSCTALKRKTAGGAKGPVVPTKSLAQEIVGDIAAPFIMDNFKGTLMWHSVGAGKSCAAMLTASHFLNKGWRVIWVSSAQLKFVPATRHFFTIKCHDQLMPNPAPKTQQGKESYLKKILDVVSFSTLANALGNKSHSFRRHLEGGIAKGKNDPLYKTLVILDEPHKIFEMKGVEKADFNNIKKAMWHSYEQSGMNSCRSLFMDATPSVVNATDLLEFLNAMQADPKLRIDPKTLEKDGVTDDTGHLTAKGKAALGQLAKGVVSYLNLSTDRTKFARPVHYSFNPVVASHAQLKDMEKCKKNKDVAGCVENAAIAINMPRRVGGKVDKNEMTKRANDSYPLLQRLIQNIKEQDEADRKEHGQVFKHAIFTNLKGLNHADNILKVLEANDFTKVNVNKASDNGVTNGVVMLSGSGLDSNQKNAITGYFNKPENANGKYARFMLIDGRFREGIDVFDTRHFHMLQPISQTEETQAVGRVLRMCGSTNLPANDNIWQVRVHLYDSVVPKGEGYESVTKKWKAAIEAATGFKENFVFDAQDVCKDVAFDKLLLRAYDVPLIDKNYQQVNQVVRFDPPCGKAKPVNADGSCPAKHVAGPNESGDATCCFSKTSKRGKELVAAANSGDINKISNRSKVAVKKAAGKASDDAVKPVKKAAGKAAGKAKVPCPRLKTQALGPDRCPEGFTPVRSKVDPDVTCCKASRKRQARK